jgi:NADPH2:quinone reductase
MKAVLCKEHGDPSVLVVEEIEAPQPGPDQVRVAVHAAGVNFPDVLITSGNYQFLPPFPFSPGMECAGEVLEVGGEVSGIAVGDRVIANPGWGCFAEEVVVSPDRLLPMPENMSFEDGAAFPITYGTTYHALVQRGDLQPGETLLVHGAGGGVGLTAVEMGKLMGATVIATAGSDEKLEVARSYGADHLINYSNERIRDRVKELTDGKGADVIYDPVGGDAMDESMRCINWGGRILVNLILLKGCAVVGVFWGSLVNREPEVNRANFETLLEWYADGKLKPHISMTLPLEQAVEALEALIARKVSGKAVLTVGGG